METYIRPKLGRIPLNKLTSGDIQQLCVWMKTDGRIMKRETRGAGISDSQIRNCYNLCRRALNQAVEEYLIPKNPALDCKAPTCKRQDRQSQELPEQIVWGVFSLSGCYDATKEESPPSPGRYGGNEPVPQGGDPGHILLQCGAPLLASAAPRRAQLPRPVPPVVKKISPGSAFRRLAISARVRSRPALTRHAESQREDGVPFFSVK